MLKIYAAYPIILSMKLFDGLMAFVIQFQVYYIRKLFDVCSTMSVPMIVVDPIHLHGIQ